MKRLYVLMIGLLCTVVFIMGADRAIRYKLSCNANKWLYYNSDARNSCDYLMDKIITENSMVVLGSSELSASDNLAYPPALFNQGNSDYNMILIGRGYMQSIHHAVSVGALQNNIKNGKVVLIVSPQWFTASHLSSEVYASRFSEEMFIEFLKNSNISKKTKTAVIKRINDLLTADPNELSRIQKYESIYGKANLNPIEWLQMSTDSLFRQFKLRYELAKDADNINLAIDQGKYVCVEDIDFDELLQQAEQIGKAACTNNDFGVYDYYFNTYCRPSYAAAKGSNASGSYTTSIEYDDLRLFLDVCRDTGIEALIISVPVNGRWYDYTEFPYMDRNQYYQNIRNICAEYGVQLADFSDREYELYFLKDIMHMGWKGWVYLDEVVYRFYKDEPISIGHQYEELFDSELILSGNVQKNENGEFIVTTDVEGNAFNAVVLQSNVSEGIIDIIDITYQTGHREGVYYHKRETGGYEIVIRANTNLRDEYIRKPIELENGCVYRFCYDVTALNAGSVSVSNISFSKMIQ